LTARILEIARRHLAEQGAAALSLRAIARELQIASSAIYRYFPSRDELLTALIVEAYDAVGGAAEQALADVGEDVTTRWLALAGAVRSWAIAHPHQYALVYGSPVPGYAAPTTTVDPAARVSLAFLGIVADGVADGGIQPGSAAPRSPAVHADLEALRELLGRPVPDRVLHRGFAVWTQLFGLVSFELFGHLHNVITDYDAFFACQQRAAARYLISG
jgi:AcrR family transcriptional regulator